MSCLSSCSAWFSCHLPPWKLIFTPNTAQKVVTPPTSGNPRPSTKVLYEYRYIHHMISQGTRKQKSNARKGGVIFTNTARKMIFEPV